MNQGTRYGSRALVTELFHAIHWDFFGSKPTLLSNRRNHETVSLMENERIGLRWRPACHL